MVSREENVRQPPQNFICSFSFSRPRPVILLFFFSSLTVRPFAVSVEVMVEAVLMLWLLVKY